MKRVSTPVAYVAIEMGEILQWPPLALASPHLLHPKGYQIDGVTQPLIDCSLLDGLDFPVHAVWLEDGRVWDTVNGFRPDPWESITYTETITGEPVTAISAYGMRNIPDNYQGVAGSRSPDKLSGNSTG